MVKLVGVKGRVDGRSAGFRYGWGVGDASGEGRVVEGRRRRLGLEHLSKMLRKIHIGCHTVLVQGRGQSGGRIEHISVMFAAAMEVAEDAGICVVVGAFRLIELEEFRFVPRANDLTHTQLRALLEGACASIVLGGSRKQLRRLCAESSSSRGVAVNVEVAGKVVIDFPVGVEGVRLLSQVSRFTQVIIDGRRYW